MSDDHDVLSDSHSFDDSAGDYIHEKITEAIRTRRPVMKRIHELMLQSSNNPHWLAACNVIIVEEFCDEGECAGHGEESESDENSELSDEQLTNRQFEQRLRDEQEATLREVEEGMA